jgi:nicotinamide-nucleotide amidase
MNRSLIRTACLLLLTGPSGPGCGGIRGETPPSEPVEYFLIVTGDEVLRGVYADAHTLYIARTLAPLGARCVGVTITPDDIASIHRALDFASRRTPLILVTGGLGPTDDDVTREALTRFTGIPLYERPEALSAMMLRFGVERAEDLRANLRRQTLAPRTGSFFPNPHGTAIGLVFDDGERVIAALPGPPSELRPMVVERLAPFLAERFGIRSPGATLTLRFVGIGESNIDEVMHRHLTLPEDLMISSLFDLDRVDLTLSLPGDTGEDRARLKALRAELMRYVGDHVYSDDGATLEESVLRLLEESGLTLITAEMGSGGGIAAGLNQAEGVERVYSGGFVVPNEYELDEMLGRVPEGEPADRPIAGPSELKAFVRAVCEKTRSDWGMVVGRVVVEGDARHVLVAYGSARDGIDVERVALRGRGGVAQARLVNRCLDLLRRKLEARMRTGDRSE